MPPTKQGHYTLKGLLNMKGRGEGAPSKRIFGSHSLSMREGKAWFAIEAKSIELAIEEKGKKPRGCIWERCKGVTSWINFGDLSLWHLLLGIEDFKNISCN